ncbi:hypothetical protein GCM10010174_88930 [Kutzneria viridogrisea]|uniref:Uncharacterized protein n=1 Tax=Kutzneria viridogrisea TaxID=47990 RepID=A0ABR6BJP0_9PSEU|nr:hypothetical protein [Kutzneria viridogrisea]
MPTARPRHMITEDDAVHAALDDAARRWPEAADRPTRLLALLIAEGHRALRERGESRAAAVAETAGALTGLYGEHYLAELREEWPA